MAQEIIYTMKSVGKVYPPGRHVLKGISLSYFYGAKIGVLGLNGSGKSTLLRIMSGEEEDFMGEAFLTQNYKVGYLPQDPKLDKGKTVKENVMAHLGPLQSYLKEFERINEKLCDENLSEDEMEKWISAQGEVQEKIEALDGWEIDQKIEKAMECLSCPPLEASVDYLSGGERRRVALCCLLLSSADILLLDEPTNHLDALSVAWLEVYLSQFPGTVIAVTHDRYFLDNVAGWILELDRGEGRPFKGNYSEWLNQKNKRMEQEEEKNKKKMKTLERELEWIRMSPRGRQQKPKARLSSYEKLLKEPSEEKLKDMQIYIPPGPRLGQTVIEAQGLCKSYGDKILMKNFNFSLPRGAVVGVVGANGEGKSTLFKLITGVERPDSGEIKIGDTVKMAYVDQIRNFSDPSRSIWEEISEGQETLHLGSRSVSSRAYLSWFNFSGSDQQKKSSALSGGEKNRVYLAKILKQGANLLLLDEPNNDLDVNTMRALEEAILNFGGSAMIISHDRWFLDRVSTHILAFEGKSQVRWFIGNYSEYETYRKKELGLETLIPKKLLHKKVKWH